MVQNKCFFPTSNRNIFDGKYEKWVRFLAVLLDYIFYNVELAEVRKMSEICKTDEKMNYHFC